MKKFKVSLLVMVVLGTLFGTGCNDMHQVFHERSGGMVAAVEPMVLKPTFSGTEEALLVTQATFPSATVTFSNLNAIAATVRSYKIDFFEVGTGQQLSALTSSGQANIKIPAITVSSTTGATGTSTTSSSTTASSTTSSSTTGTGTSTAASTGLVIDPWNEAVKTAIYGSTTTRADNKALEARLEVYCEDANGNSFALNAAFTLMP